MSDTIEDIKFPSNFLAAIDAIHSEATSYFEGIPDEAKRLAKSRSSNNLKTVKDSSAAGVGTSKTGPKI